MERCKVPFRVRGGRKWVGKDRPAVKFEALREGMEGKQTLG
jgi:hypothetical protein